MLNGHSGGLGTGGRMSGSQFGFGEADQGTVSKDSDGELSTNFTGPGKPYQVKGKALTCDLHRFLYEIECSHTAEKANKVIDPIMGKGRSNLPESKFHFLTKFRPKKKNLHQLHYEFSANHWISEFFFTVGFTEVDDID